MSHCSEGARIALVTFGKWTEMQPQTVQRLKVGLGEIMAGIPSFARDLAEGHCLKD